MIRFWIYMLFLSGGSFRSVLRSQAERLEGWRSAAASCGLDMVGITSVWTWRLKLEAQDGLIAVRIEGAQRANLATRIVVAVPRLPGFGSVRIRREVGEPGAREIEIGDEAFDRTFSIEGPMRLVCVLLDKAARRLLRKVNARCWVEIAGGELRAETVDDKLSRVLPLLVNLGRRFAESTDVVQGLVDNALRDPAAGVRLNNLLLLVRECARGPRTDEVLRAACSDRSLQVRLRAALELGSEGHGVLLAIAESMEDDDGCAQAVRGVGAELPFERATAILNRALSRRRVQTACACLEALGSSGTAEAADTLIEVLAQREGEIAAAAARALGRTASAAGEPALILALGREMPIRVAAAEALGRVGSVAAVLPLKEAAQSSRDPDLARATRQAIAEIQSRLSGASPGQLSLAGADAGQLSLAQAEAGQLSLAGKQAGQLSLSDDEDE